MTNGMTTEEWNAARTANICQGLCCWFAKVAYADVHAATSTMTNAGTVSHIHWLYDQLEVRP